MSTVIINKNCNNHKDDITHLTLSAQKTS